jgi:hypothetical protein
MALIKCYSFNNYFDAAEGIYPDLSTFVSEVRTRELGCKFDGRVFKGEEYN